MKTTDWRTIAEAIGVVAIVVSLIFVGFQLQQDRDLARVSTFASTSENDNALSELVQANNDVWVRGLKGEELSDAESAAFMSVIRAVETRYMNFIIRWQILGGEELDPELPVRAFAYYVYMYPGLRRVFNDELKLRQHRAAAFGEAPGGAPLYERALPYLKKLDEQTPELPQHRNYVIW